MQNHVMQTLVSSSNDAMGLLFSAAEHIERQVSDSPHDQTGWTPGVLSSVSLPDSVPQELLDVWTRQRFVRQGWFTAREAIAYVDL